MSFARGYKYTRRTTNCSTATYVVERTPANTFSTPTRVRRDAFHALVILSTVGQCLGQAAATKNGTLFFEPGEVGRPMLAATSQRHIVPENDDGLAGACQGHI